MSLKRKILRAIVWMIVSLLGILLVLVAAIHLDQYLLRRKAERLLADIQSLELRKSTYADARRVMGRWNGDMRKFGPCQRDSCDVQIDLRDFAWRRFRFLGEHEVLEMLYRILGGRPAWVGAFIGVRDDTVWQKGIETWIEYPAGNNVHENSYITLVGRASSSSILGSALHPEYEFGGCVHCGQIGVTFTPYADAADVKRLMEFDFACLTRWHPCETGADILPTVWREVSEDMNLSRKAAQSQCSLEMIRAMSREAERVAIGISIHSRKTPSSGQSFQLKSDVVTTM